LAAGAGAGAAFGAGPGVSLGIGTAPSAAKAEIECGFVLLLLLLLLVVLSFGAVSAVTTCTPWKQQQQHHNLWSHMHIDLHVLWMLQLAWHTHPVWVKLSTETFFGCFC
jgi:hypothetical protein